MEGGGGGGGGVPMSVHQLYAYVHVELASDRGEKLRRGGLPFTPQPLNSSLPQLPEGSGEWIQVSTDAHK